MMTQSQRWTGLHIRLRRIRHLIFRPPWVPPMDSRRIIRWWTATRARRAYLPRIRPQLRQQRWSLPLARRLPRAHSIRHITLPRNSSRQLMSHHSLVPEGIPLRIGLLHQINLDQAPCGRPRISATLATEALPFIREIKILKNGGKSLLSTRTSSTDSLLWRESWDRRITKSISVHSLWQVT